MLHYFKWILYPFAILYGLILYFRNKLYDWGIISSISFNLPVISVGNISMGGTGKTPHIEYLIEFLYDKIKLATMSRGYKRTTQGFLIADHASSASRLGDEPMQFFLKYPKVAISVCEDRVIGIPELLSLRPETDVILLDDAFQHRSVKPSLNILISDNYSPYYEDFILPFGRLRESRSAYKRADIIVISKCPDQLTIQEKSEIISKVKPLDEQKIFFTSLEYGQPYNLQHEVLPFELLKNYNILSVSGIGKNIYFNEFLVRQCKSLESLNFKDHIHYTFHSINKIDQQWQTMSEPKILITTEKDASKLIEFKNVIQKLNINLYILPIKVKFLFDEEHIFQNEILKNIKKIND